MATYTPPEVRRLWSQGKLTSEQARPAGPRHLIQNLDRYAERQAALEKRVRQLEESLPQEPSKPNP